MSNNKIEDDQLYNLLICSSITHLMLDSNLLKNVDKICILRQLPNLEQLEISENLIGDTDFYRDQLFEFIPWLKVLDCQDKYGEMAILSSSEDE